MREYVLGTTALIVVMAVFWVIGAAVFMGDTILERKVFENSYQYQEARSSALASYEAQLAEINHRLMNSDLPEPIQQTLRAQKSALRIQIETEKRRMK